MQISDFNVFQYQMKTQTACSTKFQHAPQPQRQTKLLKVKLAYRPLDKCLPHFEALSLVIIAGLNKLLIKSKQTILKSSTQFYACRERKQWENALNSAMLANESEITVWLADLLKPPMLTTTITILDILLITKLVVYRKFQL